MFWNHKETQRHKARRHPNNHRSIRLFSAPLTTMQNTKFILPLENNVLNWTSRESSELNTTNLIKIIKSKYRQARFLKHSLKSNTGASSRHETFQSSDNVIVSWHIFSVSIKNLNFNVQRVKNLDDSSRYWWEKMWKLFKPWIQILPQLIFTCEIDKK